MRIQATYQDIDSFTAEEAKSVAKNILGSNTEVQALPDSDFPEAYIRYGVQEIIVSKLIDLFYDHEPAIYQDKIDILKGGVLSQVNDITDRIIQTTEEKLMED
jgi:hypothetical protein